MEYAILFALIIVALLVSLNVLGMSVTGSFTNIKGNLSALVGASGSGPGGDGGYAARGGGARHDKGR